MKLRVLDLFSGIGGFSLGLERTGGFETVAFCEIDPFARRVLAKHWPGVTCYDDVRILTAERLAADGIGVDVICGGFPCQDLSRANGPHGGISGITGKRSGLWSEYARLIREIRPQYVLVENVTDLVKRGLGVILSDLAQIGYDAEWDCFSAYAANAPHRRDRIWIVAHAHRERLEGQYRGWEPQGDAGRGGHVAPWRIFSRADAANWLPEPRVGRVADGVPARMDRLRTLGNAVVPQITELIGRAILAVNSVGTPASNVSNIDQRDPA